MSNLFKQNSNIRDYKQVLEEVQDYLSSTYPSAFDEDNDRQKAQIKLYITKFLEEKKIAVKNLATEQLVDKLYFEMKEASFLTIYLESKDVEEINVNSWKDIKVNMADGRKITLEERFNSPQHAFDVIRRLLRTSGAILDDESPMVRGHLRDNIRITAYAPPIIDAKIGVVASIRIINPQRLSKEDFVLKGTATSEMLDQLSLLIRYGVSICIGGSTGSGKTTTLSWLLETVPHNKRIFTIEVENREFNLIVEGAGGQVLTDVVHTVTRRSDDPNRVVDTEKLLEFGLTTNPDVICVGEMKSSEAYAAQEAARTGHAVITTTHTNSCEAAYPRMRTLCKQKYDLNDKTLDEMVSEAFPIIVFQKQLEDSSRKIMEITECEILPSGERKLRTLWRYDVVENKVVNGKIEIIGRFERVETISEKMQKRLIQNGMPYAILEQYFLEGGSTDDSFTHSISSSRNRELPAPKLVAGGNG